jgi:hypothetical protein
MVCRCLRKSKIWFARASKHILTILRLHWFQINYSLGAIMKSIIYFLWISVHAFSSRRKEQGTFSYLLWLKHMKHILKHGIVMAGSWSTRRPLSRTGKGTLPWAESWVTSTSSSFLSLSFFVPRSWKFSIEWSVFHEDEL